MELRPLPLHVAGVGAVSPAGWGVSALVDAVHRGEALEYEEVQRSDDGPVVRVRRVPRPSVPPAFARAPRLRRTSPVTSFAVAAALEALGPQRIDAIQAGRCQVGVLTVMFNGCVGFSRRFYGEVLDHPATASPLIFPETVFNAPSSHLAAVIGATEANDTLVGDTAQFPTALDTAAMWLETGNLDGVLVVAAEEIDWLSSEAARLFDRSSIVAEGAGAFYLEPSAAPTALWQRPIALGRAHSRRAAATAVRSVWSAHLGDAERATLLCDGLTGSGRMEAAEREAFAGWSGPRLSSARVLGDGLGVRAAWQCVLAAHEVAAGRATQALVSAIGTNQQAMGVLFGRPSPSSS